MNFLVLKQDAQRVQCLITAQSSVTFNNLYIVGDEFVLYRLHVKIFSDTGEASKSLVPPSLSYLNVLVHEFKRYKGITN